jgi:hypothetical protein
VRRLAEFLEPFTCVIMYYVNLIQRRVSRQLASRGRHVNVYDSSLLVVIVLQHTKNGFIKLNRCPSERI